MRAVLFLLMVGCGDGLSSTVQCGPGAATSFPTFDRSCQSASDCLAVTHVTSCCGSVAAVINQDCTDPARPQCYQNHCYPANVACGTR